MSDLHDAIILAIHNAICEDSLSECKEYNGLCIDAAGAAIALIKEKK